MPGGEKTMVRIALLCLWAASVFAAQTPYQRYAMKASVWSQAFDARAMDTADPAEYRETLGVFPVGNGSCFTYAGLGIPQNTLFMITGPRYQTAGNHNPVGGFGELSLHLLEQGQAVSMPHQGCKTVRGAPVALTSERGSQMQLTTVTAAPPGLSAILRWITVERLSGKTGDITVALEFRGRQLQHKNDDFFFEYPHRNRIARMHPFVPGQSLKENAGKLVFSIPKLTAGAPRTFLLALVFSESAKQEKEVKEQVLAQHETLLDAACSWWRKKLAPTVHVKSGDRRLDDLVEGLKVLLLVQQDAQGGVCPMVNFKGVWLRDSNGPLLGFLHTGLYDEARRLLTYYRQVSALHKFTGREFPLDLDVASDPDLSADQWAKTGTDRCEVPSFVVLQHAWWFDATGDKALLKRHWHYVLRNATHQVLIDGPHGPLQTFNGDETYMGGAYYSLFPARSGYPNGLVRQDAFSADSMFEYAAAQAQMARLASFLEHKDKVAQFKEAEARMRSSIEKHLWLSEENRYAPALSPIHFVPHRAPFAPINLRPLWVGYLRPGDPHAKSNVENTLKWLWRPCGLVRMTPFLDYFIGCAPGYLLSNLAALRHNQAEKAFSALIDSASKSGEWVEVHKPNRPSYGYGNGRYANRLRPWESGINLDAILFYLTGARRTAGRSITIKPLLPPGCEEMVVENIPIGDARLKLTVKRNGAKADYTVCNTSRNKAEVNDRVLAPGGKFSSVASLPVSKDSHAHPFGGKPGEAYRERLYWKGNVRTLTITAQRKAAGEGGQLFDVGLPFSPPDFAAFLRARPESLKAVEVDASAQVYSRQTLKPFLEVLKAPEVKEQIERFESDGGKVVLPLFVRKFLLRGPVADPDQKLLAADPDFVTAPYDASKWRPYTSPSGYVNLDAVMRPNNHVAAFARFVLETKTPQKVLLHLGADDGVVLWVGGKRIFERLGHHHHQFGRDRITCELPAGKTPVIVGVHEINGAWGFSLRISDPEGRTPEGLVVE